MWSSTLPDGMPVLSRGRHRTPRRGACFMELASLLAGERWSDHPRCTHPLLGQLARAVNDYTSDTGRQALAPMIPSVVGRRGDEHTWLSVSVAVAADTILDVPEATQHVLAAGLMRAEQLCGPDRPEREAIGEQAQAALGLVPGAVGWVERLGVRGPINDRAFAQRSAPTLVKCGVEGIVASGRPDLDDRLRAVLEVGIAACPAPAPVAPRPAPQAPAPDVPAVSAENRPH